MKSVKLIIIGIFILTSFGTSIAQVGYNPLSVRPILEDDIMYRKRVERRINLKEKQNMPFFAQDIWITQAILDGVASNELTPYRDQASVDSLVPKYVMTQEDWKKQLADSSSGVPVEGGRQITVLDITEEYIFDKRRSRMYIDILSVKLIVLPSGTGGPGLITILAQFKYKDLHEYFKKLYARSNQTQAYWFNPKNDRRKLCFSDALDLRLFSSRITKISNPSDDRIGDELTGEYSTPLKQLYRSQEIEYELMEYEHNLWEF